MVKAEINKLFLALFVATAFFLGSALCVFASGQGYGPGRVGLKVFMGRDHVEAGAGGIWNSRDKLHIQVDPADGWRIKKMHIWVDVDLPPVTTTGNPKIGYFNYMHEFPTPYVNYDAEDGHIFRRTLVFDLFEDLGFQWGQPWEYMRTQCVAVYMDLVKLDSNGILIGEKGAWVIPELIVLEDVIDEAVVETDAIIALETTGEVVADAVAETNDNGRNDEKKVANEEHQKAQQTWEVEDLVSVEEFEGGRWGWWFRYEIAHPRRAHFIDSPVGGLFVKTPTFAGVTDESGGFDYFPGERVDISIGSVVIGNALADHKISPIDIFKGADTEDERVINMAILLQSLDADGNPKKGVSITPGTGQFLSQAMTGLGIDTLNFEDTTQIDSLVDNVIVQSQDDESTDMVKVSAEEAKANLDKSLNTDMFRKNIARTPEMASAKAKLNIMGVWMPALKANGDDADYIDENGVTQTGIPYYDSPDPVVNEDGTFTYPEPELIRVATEAKPIVGIYCDEVETGAHDVFASISRDDGNTWKRKNISRMADRSSFTLANGQEYYGHCKKPVFHVKGNKILIAWTTKFAKGGKPRYSIVVDNPATPDIDEGDGYTYDDPYYTDDIWGVSGPQRSVDYTDQGYPEVGEVPYSAVWVERGLILTASDLTKAPWNVTTTDPITGETLPLHYVGEIVWFKPERLTSGRRDANQNFLGGADGAGFAVTWQEDPGGLRPGEAKGPGPGWGGATTNHKTDIWYSYITWGDFGKVDVNFEPGGDPEHFSEDFVGRPKALVPMSLPVRVSDNDVVNTDNMYIKIDAETGLPVVDGYDSDGNPIFIPILNPDTNSEDSDGSHRYGYMLDDLWNWDENLHVEGAINNPTWTEGSGTLYKFTNQQDEEKTVVVTADGRALDGNTGAARPNLFLQTYTNNNGTPDDTTDDFKSAWAIMAYEETKGVGLGPPEDTGTGEQPLDGSGYDPLETFPDSGKNAIYHSFEFQNPDVVSAGTILNLPETDDLGNPVYVTEVPCFGSDENGDCIVNPDAGEQILDWKGDPILAYENARRPRFILQSKPAAFGGTKPDGSFKEPGNSGTVLIVLYKEGEEGAGRPSDIMARRCVVKNTDGTIKGGNPWNPANFVPHNDSDPRVAVQNVSTVTPLTTWINPDRDEDAKGDGVKVCTWEQPEANLALKSGVNPYEDARAHRGQIRGDFVIMGYSFTPNWAASRNAHDKYDFYIRRSFNGGETWTTDPTSEVDVDHTDIFIDPEGVLEGTLNEEGDDESEAPKHFEVLSTHAGGGVYEPAKNVSLIQNNKVSVIEPRIVAVPGTIKDPATKLWTGIAEDKQNRNVFYLAYGTSTNLRDVEKAPEDLFFSFSTDMGTTMLEDEWVVNPDSAGNNAGTTVEGWYRLAKGDQEQGEVQLRMTPDGSRFYSVWLDEGEEGSDIMFRRIMPGEFSANNVIP